jgi:predicted small secreted protein
MRALVKGVCASVVAALLLAGPVAIMGCNTTEGAGKDIKKAGEKLEDTAHDAK